MSFTAKDMQRWKITDLDDEIVVNCIWGSWTSLMNLAQFLHNEQQITTATYEQMVQELMDIKTVLAMHISQDGP